MKTIWKYVLSDEDWQILEVPKVHKVLSAQNQNDSVSVWVGVDSTSPKTATIGIFQATTGNPILLQDMTFLDTVQLFRGEVVIHIFYQEGK